MALLIPLDTAPAFAPEEGSALPERLLDGAPAFKTWGLDTAAGPAAGWDRIRTGIWEATPGKTISIKGETFEFCHILAGRVVISEDGGESHTFVAGDSFLMKPGFVGTWQTLETVRKIYVIAG